MTSITQLKKDRVKLLEALKDMVHDQIPDSFDRKDQRYLKAIEKELKTWIKELEKDAKEPLKDNT